MKTFFLFLLLSTSILIGQSKQTIDTLDVEEIEWIDNTAQKKGENKPFTGMVTLPGVLNYPRNSKRGWYKPSNEHFSTVTFVSGIFNGAYTKLSKKNGKKVSEFTITGHWTKIIPHGPYTLWYENDQMADNGIYKNGKRSGNRTTWYKNGQKKGELNYVNGTQVNKTIGWYENGQIMREGSFQNGKRTGKFIVWDEDGKKSFEPTYYNDKIIKSIERDVDGNILKEWPEVDKDNYGLKLFLNEFASILNSKNYDGLKNLLPSKEDVISAEFLETGKEPSIDELKILNDKLTEIISKEIDEVKKQVVEYNYIFENLTINNIIYDYKIINEDNSTNRVKWPKSINYDISTAKYVTAEITIVLEPYAIAVTAYYLNNKWIFGITGKGGIIEVKF